MLTDQGCTSTGQFSFSARSGSPIRGSNCSDTSRHLLSEGRLPSWAKGGCGSTVPVRCLRMQSLVGVAGGGLTCPIAPPPSNGKLQGTADVQRRRQPRSGIGHSRHPPAKSGRLQPVCSGHRSADNERQQMADLRRPAIGTAVPKPASQDVVLNDGKVAMNSSAGAPGIGHYLSSKHQMNRVANDRFQGTADVARHPFAATKSPKRPLKDW